MRAAILFIALMSTAASAQTTVAGITLGAPLAAPQCAPRDHLRGYLPSETSCHFQQNRYGRPANLGNGWRVLTVQLDRSEAPRMIKGAMVEVFLDGETVVAMRFQTYGLESQASDLNALAQKFGKPSSRTSERFQNGLGAKFDGALVSWIRKDVHVQYYGLFPDLETGMVIAALPTGVKLIDADNRRLVDEMKRL